MRNVCAKMVAKEFPEEKNKEEFLATKKNCWNTLPIHRI